MGVDAVVYTNLKAAEPPDEETACQDGYILIDEWECRHPQSDDLVGGWYTGEYAFSFPVSNGWLGSFLEGMCHQMVGVSPAVLWASSPHLHAWSRPSGDRQVESRELLRRLLFGSLPPRPYHLVTLPRPYPSRAFEELLYHLDSSGIIGPRTSARILAMLREHMEGGLRGDDDFREFFALCLRAFELASTRSGAVVFQ
jgi:hypothetical protein